MAAKVSRLQPDLASEWELNLAEAGRKEPGAPDDWGVLAQQLYAKTLPKLPLESVMNSILARR
jgi:hypothetical protein